MKNVWVPLVQETDALLVGGGDALYLCYWMRQSGLADLLPSLRRETVYVGVSAGSMVMTPNIGEDFVELEAAHRWRSERWDWLIFRYFRTWITRIPGQFPGQRGKMGRQACRCRRTRLTIRPPSKWSTAPSTSSPRGTGSCLPPFCQSSVDRQNINGLPCAIVMLNSCDAA